MTLWQEYRSPRTVEDALAALAAAPAGRVIAGGTDLLLDLQQGRAPEVQTLIDLTRIPELMEIRQEGDTAFVGAAVTHARIAEDPVLRASAGCLAKACSLIGGPQVRNVATLGGNVAHALPAADGSIALLALDADAQLASQAGRRWTPVHALFRGPGLPGFDREREIVVGFRFRLCGPGERTAFQRIMRPQGVAIAIQNMAAWIAWSPDQEVLNCRLAVGAAGPTPLRARLAEACLGGKKIEDATLREALEALRSEARLRTSPHRATESYRARLLEVLLRRTLMEAMAEPARASDHAGPPG